MKRVLAFPFGLLFAVYFCAGFVIVFKLITPFIEDYNTQSVENKFLPDFEVLAFTRDDVEVIELDELAAFRRQNPDFSFRVLEGREKYFEAKLNEKAGGTLYTLETERINKERQLIRLSYDDVKSLTRNTYEATDQELFPKTTMWVNFRHTFLKILPGTFGGALLCLFFYFFHRKYLD